MAGLYEVNAATHSLDLHFHAGQRMAWESPKRVVAVIAGTQSGKTSFGPLWFQREIQAKGPGDYLIATPTFPLLNLKALPEFLNLFRRLLGLGDYVGSPARCFKVSTDGEKRLFGKRQEVPTQVFFGHAQDPDSLESATAKAAWLDEAGQNKFKLASYEAIRRRLAIHRGRILITTTPYNLGWLKSHVYDPWIRGDENVEVVRFESIMNPAFPQEEYELARKSMPSWKFDMFYRGIFTRPAGMIYDCFDEDIHRVERFAIPNNWKRYLGVDFGGVNTAAVFLAREPITNKLFVYREYKSGSRTAAEHAAVFKRGEPAFAVAVGGSKSEDQWRDEFSAAGLFIREPDQSDVEVGIDRVYGAIRRQEVFIFSDLELLLEDIRSYSRELNDKAEPTEKIEDKNEFHLCDAIRYICGWLCRGRGTGTKIGFSKSRDREFGLGVPLLQGYDDDMAEDAGDWPDTVP